MFYLLLFACRLFCCLPYMVAFNNSLYLYGHYLHNNQLQRNNNYNSNNNMEYCKIAGNHLINGFSLCSSVGLARVQRVDKWNYNDI